MYKTSRPVGPSRSDSSTPALRCSFRSSDESPRLVGRQRLVVPRSRVRASLTLVRRMSRGVAPTKSDSYDRGDRSGSGTVHAEAQQAESKNRARRRARAHLKSQMQRRPTRASPFNIDQLFVCTYRVSAEAERRPTRYSRSHTTTFHTIQPLYSCPPTLRSSGGTSD